MPDPEFHGFDPRGELHSYQYRLPHWRQPGSTYFVTFHLGDSLPAAKLQAWREERELWLTARGLHDESQLQTLSAAKRESFHRHFGERLNEWLDAGTGSCVLGQPEAAAIVAGALRHFHGDRYALDEFVIMPNHVHVLVTPAPDHELEHILQSWKGFTARQINRLIGRAGPLWQQESYDRIVRDPAELEHFREYIRLNPVKAHLPPARFILGRGQRIALDTGEPAALGISQRSALDLGQPITVGADERSAGLSSPESISADSHPGAGKPRATLRPAVFLDRDGTLMHDTGYISDPAHVRLFDGVREALGELKTRGFLLVIVTNQSGIGRGYFTRADFEAVQARFLELLGPDLIDATYLCDDHPDHATARRKPAPGMLLEAARDLAIDLPRSWMIGDREADIEAGRAAGTRTILVLTGEARPGAKTRAQFVTQDLASAAAFILETIASQENPAP